MSSPKTLFLVGNFKHPKLGTIILIVLDFQGYYMFAPVSLAMLSKKASIHPNRPQTDRFKHMELELTYPTNNCLKPKWP